MTFERLLVDVNEPRFSGSLTLRPPSGRELVGRMTEEGSISLGQPITLLWGVAGVRRQP